jgi:putative ABC transport system substrate-binding protein
MKRRSFLTTLVGTLVTGPVVASAQPAGKVYRIGHLAASSPSAENTRLLGAFQAELRERGWVEGQNVAFEYRWAEGRYERLAALAAELTETKVDLIVAGGTPNAVAAREVTRVIPIVMIGAW